MDTTFEHNSGSERLDTALAKRLGVSRASAQRAIKEGRVFVNGVSSKAHALLTTGSKVAVHPTSTIVSDEPQPLPELDVIWENADVLVVNKPAGVLVHPTPTSREPTLMDAVLNYAPAIKGVGGDVHRSGIVHRLDREASGVLIMAKHDRAHKHLKEQFKQRLTQKHYTALILGKIANESGSIDFPIARSTSGGRMAARPKSQAGKDALTHYTVTRRFTTSTLVDIQIETGRTHQIRAHFFAIGHPVAGDKLYVRRGVKPLTLNRLFLHARELSLTLPSGEHQTFASPLPLELQEVLEKLKPAR